jgi:hypothetical protein
MKRLLLSLTLAGTVAALAAPFGWSAVHVLPLSAQPNGWTYHQWHAIWNRRSLERDFRSHHALFASRNGQCGQKVGQAKAWLLPFRYVTQGELTARCRIKPGTRLVADIAGAIGVYGGPERLKAQVEAGWPAIQSVSLTLDGRVLTPHVIQTPFIHANLPHYNAQDLKLPQTTVSFISRDYFAILSPISRGRHVLRTSWTVDVGKGPETYSMTFRLNVR